jgi:hypothetical protein
MGGAGSVQVNSIIYQRNQNRTRKVMQKNSLYLAPNMRRVLVHERLSRVTGQKFRDNEQSDVLLAVESLLKDMTAVTICCKFDDATTG